VVKNETLSVTSIEPLSAAFKSVLLKPVNVIVPAPVFIVAALLIKVVCEAPPKSAALLILAMFVTLKVIAVSSVDKASASFAVAPPSLIVNL
jgi:hypothetical protein